MLAYFTASSFSKNSASLPLTNNLMRFLGWDGRIWASSTSRQNRHSHLTPSVSGAISSSSSLDCGEEGEDLGIYGTQKSAILGGKKSTTRTMVRYLMHWNGSRYCMLLGREMLWLSLSRISEIFRQLLAGSFA